MSPAHQSRRDYLKLHGIVLLWGGTAILGKLIQLPALEIVFLRSSMAAIVLAPLLRNQLFVKRRDSLWFLANGGLIGAHWVTFFAAAKIANVSTCMVGMATISLWTAILEPLLIRTRKIRWDELLMGSMIVAAVYWIFRGDSFQNTPSLAMGLSLAIFSAILAALFSIFNGMLVNRADHRVIVTYEMAGASLICAATMVVFVVAGLADAASYQFPVAIDWLWISILAIVCTVYAYSAYVELLKRLSVFTINFANNLEPLYGIFLGAIIFQDYEQVGSTFYSGTAFIGLIVAIEPWISIPKMRRRMSLPKHDQAHRRMELRRKN